MIFLRKPVSTFRDHALRSSSRTTKRAAPLGAALTNAAPQLFVEHDLSRKPVSTFRDHALVEAVSFTRYRRRAPELSLPPRSQAGREAEAQLLPGLRADRSGAPSVHPEIRAHRDATAAGPC